MSKKNRQQSQSKKPSTLVDIVVPIFRSFDLLEKCLESIPKGCGEIPYNLILVDNGSPKEEADEFYKKLDPKIAVIRNKENLGFPKACNQGARRKASPLIFFLNSDATLFENSVDHLVRALDDPEIGIVGMKLIFPEYSQSGVAGTIQHVGMSTNIRGDWEHIFIGWNPNHPKVLQVREVLGVTGAALMIRRNLFNQVSGWDEMYGRGTYEDQDLCLKVRQLGKKIIVEQKAMGTHYAGGTAARFNMPYPMNRNKMLFLTKWQGSFPWTEYLHR